MTLEAETKSKQMRAEMAMKEEQMTEMKSERELKERQMRFDAEQLEVCKSGLEQEEARKDSAAAKGKWAVLLSTTCTQTSYGGSTGMSRWHAPYTARSSICLLYTSPSPRD